jgi:hypothetical protein
MKITTQKSVLYGLVLGIVCILVEVPSWIYLIPWILSWLLIGYFSTNKKSSVINGFLFGYFLFMFYNHHHILRNTSFQFSYFNFLLSTLFFSLAGGIQGMVGSYFGFYIKGLRNNNLINPA